MFQNVFKRFGFYSGRCSLSMNTHESCCKQLIRFLQRRWQLIVSLSLTIVITAFAFSATTFAQEDKTTTPAPTQQKRSVISPPKETSAKSPKAAERPSSAPKNKTNAEAGSDKNAESADNADEDKPTDPAEILDVIRKSWAAKNKDDISNDDLILSQYTSFIFLNRKSVRDVSGNILDSWLLSSFEETLNLTLIDFSFIEIRPVKVNLDSDVVSQLSLENVELPVLDNLESPLTLTVYVSFPLPESVMEFVNEHSEEIVSSNAPTYLSETFSTFNYWVLLLAFLGFSILGYMIYRIVVWIFMLDQNREYDINYRKDEDVVVPLTMDAYNAYLYQSTPEDNQK